MNYRLCLLILLFICAGNVSRAESPKDMIHTVVATTVIDTLPNGLVSAICPTGTTGTVSLQIWVKTGSRNDPVGLSGISHLFEHLMFRGSKQVPSGEYRSFIESYGGNVAAFTTEDVIVFQANFPAAILERVLAMEADRFASLTLSNETIDQERQTVLSERAAKVDGSLRNKVLEQLNSLAFPSHPYGRPTYGQTEELKLISLADCESYFKQFFSPQNITLIIAGDLETDQTTTWIESYFKSIPAGSSTHQRHLAPTEQPGPRRLDLTFGGPQDQLIIGWVIPDAANPDLTYLRLLSRVMESRFKLNALTPVEHKLTALSFHVSVDDRDDAGLFISEINGKWSPEVTDPLLVWAGLLENYKDAPITAAETDLAKNLYLGELQWSLDGAKGIAEREAYGLCYIGKADALVREQETITKAVAESLNRVWKTYLISNHRSAIVVRGGSR